MKRLSTNALSAVSLSLACLSASAAIKLSDKTDLRFAEEYAFATNRAALVATLRPQSNPWYTYSILLAQTEGRLDDAAELIERWRETDGRDRSALRAFEDRQTFLCWKDSAPKPVQLRTALGNCGISVDVRQRETALAPNTYPSRLDQKAISFEAFLKNCSLADNFEFLPVTKEGPFGEKGRDSWRFNPNAKGLLPDTPGLFDAALQWLKSDDKLRMFMNSPVFRGFTLEQLYRLADELKGTPVDLRANSAYADLVLAKLSRGADDDPDDTAGAIALAKKRVEFVDTLLAPLDKTKRREYRAYLELMRSCGKYAEARGVFAKYVGLLFWARDMADTPVSPDDIAADYLAAYRRSGDDLSEFAVQIEQGALAKIRAETDLLSGKDPASVNTGCFSPSEFKSIQERVELKWTRSNPKTFAADDDVSLSIDVKNVKRMRVSIYRLDPFAACRILDGEAKADLDLDAAVPTAVRVIDYPQYSSVVRHTETLDLPELKSPGVYVVDCTGGGVASRALVRKGRLRVTQRRDSAGHVFTALDEKGAVVKGTKLRLGETVFAADETGEIAVPFATDGSSFLESKTAVVTDGRLASTISFDHDYERIGLTLGCVLPSETLVAGSSATALLRPRLSVSGVAAPIALLKNPVLTATFVDLDGRKSDMTFGDAALADDAETAVSFRVPRRLQDVSFTLRGTVRSAETGKDEECSASCRTTVNAIERTTTTGQAVLRQTSSGWRLELRGRTGEPLPSRAVSVDFHHRAFDDSRIVSLQADERGAIELGALQDITCIDVKFEGTHYKWDINADEMSGFPYALSAAEGEDFEIPLRGLFAGEWPGAKKMNFRLSLLELNADDVVVSDRLSACSYDNGVLRIAGLPAGNYALRLRDRGSTCRLYVAAAAPGSAGAGGVIASAARSLSDSGEPALMRIASAERGKDGAVKVRLENFSPETRVHVFAARTRGVSGEARPFAAMINFLERSTVSIGTWGGRSSDYVSGRDLGERLRYILDRRDMPRRTGNMLFKPSLLLSPWSTTETETRDIQLADGESWAEAADSGRAGSVFRCGSHYGDMPAKARGFNCWDFLPQAEKVVANVRPDKDGNVVVALDGPWQDVSVVATDGRALDHVDLLGEADDFSPVDLTHRAVDSASSASLSKGYATVGELFGLAQSLGGGASLPNFRPIADWPSLDADAKRAFYGEHVCHELNFFLYMKDRPFFDAVVAPHLKNKRIKQFMDKWLLGEDVSEYAKPGRLDELNALEQGLLAIRVPSIAPVVARRMSDECAAHPTSPEALDAAFDIALDVMNTEAKTEKNAKKRIYTRGGAADTAAAERNHVDAVGAAMPAAAPAMSLAAAVDDEAVEVEVLEAPPDTKLPVEPVVKSAVKMKSVFGSTRAARESLSARAGREISRRSGRQLYRPPERTREWVESHWWKARQGEDTSVIVPVNEFWRDWTAAIASGKQAAFRSANFCLVRTGLAAQIAALAVVDLPFAAKEGDEGLVFRRDSPASTGGPSPVVATQRFRDPKAARADGSLGAEVSDEFVRGRTYELVTVLTNPTDERRHASLFVQIPEGAIALGGVKAAADEALVLEPYSVVKKVTSFYFPECAASKDGADSCALPAAKVTEADGSLAIARPFTCRVVAKSSKKDDASWAYISQNGSKGAVLEYLREKNLAGIDLGKIQWRMSDDDFAKKSLDVLAKRGVYCQDLWLAGLLWKGSFDAARIREALARRENAKKLGRHLGPVLNSPLAVVDPEFADVFEHKEYWPIINPRAHVVGGRTEIANEGLKNEYRAFLDVLAAKRKLDSRDRLLAAVYLIAQDRVDEAKRQVAAALPAKEPYRMQLDYLRAYLAFCDGDAESGRAIAAKYSDYAVPVWRDRFRAVVAQADEALGVNGGASLTDSDADSAPTISMSEEGGRLSVKARNLEVCTLKAYPVDIEVQFSKDPFGTEAKGRETVRCLVPAWSLDVQLRDGAAIVDIPAEMKAQSLVLVAEGADGRAEARLERTPREFDVQVSREYRQLRVKGRDGKAIAGAYVKVYAKGASGSGVEFHKDGYTDMRGAFDYASISTDSPFKPAEFSILVLPEGRGAYVQRVSAND